MTRKNLAKIDASIWKAIVDNSPRGILVIDKALNVIHANNVGGAGFKELFSKENTANRKILLRNMERGRSWKGLLPSSGNKWFTIKLAKIGKDTFVLYLLEVSENMRASAYQRFLSSVVEGSADAIITKTIDGYVTSWNKGAEKLYKYKPREMIGKNIKKIFPRIKLHELEEIDQRLKRGLASGPIETERINKLKKPVFVSVTVSPIFNDKGTVIGGSVIAQDISLKRKAEAELRDSEKKFRTLADLLPSAVWVLDGKGKMEYKNKGFESFIDGDEKGLWRIHPDDREYTINRWKEAIRNKLPFETSYRVKDVHEHYRWLLVKSIPLLDSENNITRWFGTGIDITDQKESEIRKSQFISIAGHELKTPLTSLNIYTELLKKKMRREGEAEQLQLLNRMSAQINKVNLLVDELLNVSRIESGRLNLKYSKVKLKPYLTELISELQLVSRTHKIKYGAIPNVTIKIDKTRFSQVVTNLITNAIKYSPGKKLVEIDIEIKNRILTFSVKDHGIGVSEEEQKHIFEPFYRVSTVRGERFFGLGLGLYISKRIVESHGGTLSLSSVPKKGSIFTVKLPMEAK